MSRINIPTHEEAPAESQPILENMAKNFGFVPNVLRLLSTSPTVLQAFVGLQSTLAKTLDARTREGIALSVSHANNCDYCMAMHSLITNTFGQTPKEEIDLNLDGKSKDPKKGAAALFGKRLIETRGKVTDADLEAVRGAGFTEAQIVEITAFTAQVLMTNFINNVANTDIDIPAVKAT